MMPNNFSRSKPLISVVIPCYLQAHYLLECTKSLQAQSYPHWEAIIVNDGSTDNTRKIALDLCDLDSRIRYIEQTNKGLSNARNAGVANVEGEFIQFLDADDLLLAKKFERHLSIIEEIGSEIITYSEYFHGDRDSPMVRVEACRVNNKFELDSPLLDIASRWEHDLSIPIHTALFPTWLFTEHHIKFDESLPNHEDWDFWMQVMTFVNVVLFIPDELAVYRYSDSSMSRNKYKMWKGFNSAIIKQRLRFAADKDVIDALNFLKFMNNYNNGHGFRAILKSLIDQGFFKFWPWPLQKKLKLLSNPPRNPLTSLNT